MTICDTTQPGPDAEREAVTPTEQPRTPERSLLGLAAMLRSGGYDPEDAGWVSRSLEHAAAYIATLTTRAERAEGERDAALAREARLRELLVNLRGARPATDLQVPAGVERSSYVRGRLNGWDYGLDVALQAIASTSETQS